MACDGKLCGDLNGGYMHYIEECIDSLCDSGDKKKFNLSTFEPNDSLNNKIWLDNGLLNSRVRLRLLDIADDFVDFLDIDWVEVKDIILTGSLANFNWSKYSDLDVHIIINYGDVDDKVDLVSNYLNSKKKLWNEEHESIKIYGFPVEMYVQDESEEHVSSGIYSLEKNEWIVKPKLEGYEGVSLNKKFINNKVSELVKRIDVLCNKIEDTDDDFELDKLANKVKTLFDKIKGARKEGLKKSGEYNSFNIIFKVLRRIGYLDKLYELKIKTYDKLKSLK